MSLHTYWVTFNNIRIDWLPCHNHANICVTCRTQCASFNPSHEALRHRGTWGAVASCDKSWRANPIVPQHVQPQILHFVHANLHNFKLNRCLFCSDVSFFENVTPSRNWDKVNCQSRDEYVTRYNLIELSKRFDTHEYKQKGLEITQVYEYSWFVNPLQVFRRYCMRFYYVFMYFARIDKNVDNQWNRLPAFNYIFRSWIN